MRLLSLATATTLGLATLTACGESNSDIATDPTVASESPSEPVAPSSPDESSPDADEQESPSERDVPAYWVGETPQGPRLYMEMNSVTGEPLLAAAKLIAGGMPEDPDYRTLWPQVEIGDVVAEDGRLVVTLADDGFTELPDGMPAREVGLILQQMVYTLQDVQQERLPVQFRRTTGPQRLFGVAIDEPIQRRRDVRVRALVNITDPAQGATVDGDTLEVSGMASSFEATVAWDIVQDGTVLLSNSITAEGWLNRLYPWEDSLDISSLMPGTYTFVARTDEASTEGPGPTEDSRDFTVK